ncbi:MAG: DUF3822 family protein [Lewinellaceae bacterium]|nr:DUF3822 family protein [Lewinellaceae bacterium]
MDKCHFDYIDPSFDANSAAQATLNVIVGTESISLYGAGPAGEPLALKTQALSAGQSDTLSLKTEWSRILDEEAILNWSYESARCAVFNAQATLVPRRMFDADRLPEYFTLLLPPGDYTYGYDVLTEYECFLAYAADPALASLADQYFPGEKPTHLATSWLKHLHNVAPANDFAIFANLRHQMVQVAVLDRQNLLFYNSFQCQRPNDLLYYILLVYDQFKLDPETIPLTLSGCVEEGSETFRLLLRYIREIRLAQTAPQQRQGPAGIPGHYWLDLACLAAMPRS